jgi:hypothetical protein
MQRGGVHYRTPLLIPLTVGEVVQRKRYIQPNNHPVLIPLTVGEVIQQWGLDETQ